MLTPEHFEIPLEKQLKMRLVYDDIERCNDIKVLKESLRQVSDQLMKYQHLLGKLLEEQLLSELEKWDIEATKIVKEASNDSDA